MTPAFSARVATAECCDMRPREGLSPYVVLLGLMLMHWPTGALVAASVFQSGEMPTVHAGHFFTFLIERARQTGDVATFEDLQQIIRCEAPEFVSIMHHVAGVPMVALLEDPAEMMAALRDYADSPRDLTPLVDAYPVPAPLPPPKPIGALERWRKRPTQGDALSRAAAYDLQGIEALNAGLVETARLFFERAAREVGETKPRPRPANRPLAGGASRHRPAWQVHLDRAKVVA